MSIRAAFVVVVTADERWKSPLKTFAVLILSEEPSSSEVVGVRNDFFRRFRAVSRNRVRSECACDTADEWVLTNRSFQIGPILWEFGIEGAPLLDGIWQTKLRGKKKSAQYT